MIVKMATKQWRILLKSEQKTQHVVRAHARTYNIITRTRARG